MYLPNWLSSKAGHINVASDFFNWNSPFSGMARFVPSLYNNIDLMLLLIKLCENHGCEQYKDANA